MDSPLNGEGYELQIYCVLDRSNLPRLTLKIPHEIPLTKYIELSKARVEPRRIDRIEVRQQRDGELLCVILLPIEKMPFCSETERI